ncbi:phosphate acyltransferase, partial [Salmonella enterica]|uniref:phosphate acyltransferase n=1 Tax=Salmonella enterica TaxID=28901 RepID=UPI0032990E1A
ASPILVGRPANIENRKKRFGLRLQLGRDVTIVNTEHDERHREFWMEYHRLMMRRGVTAQYAKLEMRRRTTLIAAMLLR